MLDTDDTIVAVASAAGPSARGIVRISGPRAISALQSCFQSPTALPELRQATRVTGQLMLNCGRIPCDAYIWPGQRSYTRQPSVELHTIGSPPLLAAAVEQLCLGEARLAEPGEFTLRAFLAGRLDLTQAEAVLGVIQSQSEQQLAVSLRQLAGGLATPLHQLRDELLQLLAHLEAGLDFVEEDIEFISREQLLEQLSQIGAGIGSVQDQLTRRSDDSEVPTIVLQGSPNVGKSSLLNALAETDAAVVSKIAGTTRDYITCDIEVDGIRCRLTDTAGVDQSVADESIDAAAQQATQEQTAEAALILFCLDASRPMNEWEQATLTRQEADRIVVWTKTDLAASLTQPPDKQETEGIATSSRTRRGLEQLQTAIAKRLSDRQTTSVASTAIRCRNSLCLAAGAVENASVIADQQLGEELVASELRVALEHLGRVVGAVYTDDVLDRIFGQFCIGK